MTCGIRPRTGWPGTPRCRWPITDVQWILGHAHLTTTQIYLNPSVEEAVAALRAHQARQARAGTGPVPPAAGYDPRSLEGLFGRRP